MGTKTASGKGKIDALRTNAAEARAELGDTVGTLAEKADGAATRMGRWIGAGASVLAGTVAALAGGAAWRRRRNTPRRRAERAWRALTARLPGKRLPGKRRSRLTRRVPLVNRFR